jgi:hypothetical protein
MEEATGAELTEIEARARMNMEVGNKIFMTQVFMTCMVLSSVQSIWL